MPAAGSRLDAAEEAENFPVAMRVLPRRHRVRLRAVYGVVRTIDDLGDEGPADPGERIAALEAFLADLRSGRPTEPVLRELAAVAPDLPHEPFERLIRANVRDQHQSEYADWADLLSYCALSADPIGRIVLAVFEVPERPALLTASDAVCSALQVLEHCQDLREDRARGRVYLPADDLALAGATPADLDRPVATAAVREVVRREACRAEELLAAGAPIVRELRGWARLAVAGYVAGGWAAADALHRVGYDVLAHRAPSRQRDVLRHLPVALLGRTPTRRSCP